jgi:RimJ/RimL family protein N-acetyltransferase
VSVIGRVVIRDAAPPDARGLAGVHVASWRWAYHDDLPAEFLGSLSVDDRERAWVERLAAGDPAAGTQVAEDNGRIVGFCSFGPTRDEGAPPGTAEVFAIYLLPEAAGRGIGRDLFASAIDRLRAMDYGRAMLWVMASNERARRFYERAGWSWDGTTSEHRFDCANLPIVRYAADL